MEPKQALTGQKVTEKSPVHNALDTQNQIIANLIDTVGILEDRLTLILTQGPVDSSVDPSRVDGKKEESLSPNISTRIYSNSDEIEKARAMIQNIISKLEI